MDMGKILNRAGWLISACTALILSAYSLYFVGRAWGIPWFLAALLSVTFDGASIVSADKSLDISRAGNSAFSSRVLTLIFASLSAYINSYHAVISHDPAQARLLFAAPPVVALALFDQHTRYERRAALKRAGRVPAALPVIGWIRWVMFPIQSYRLLRLIAAQHLDRIAKPASDNRTANQPGLASVDTSEVDTSELATARVKRSKGNNAAVRLWAKSQGLDVGERGRIPQPVHDLFAASANGAGH